jgi:hypothetical protein
MNYLVVLFKNKIKKKIINKFKTSKRANDYYNSLLECSDDVIFDKKYENGFECSYEIAILEKTSGTFLPVFLKDEFGRNIKINLDDEDYTISKINKYQTEELILDYQTNTKVSSSEFIKKYLSGSGLKLVSKLNNKIVVQSDDVFNLFTLKNDDDSSRFIDSISKNFLEQKKMDCIFVKDYSTTQRKYLYNLLTEKGFSKQYLQRQSTTHPSIKT